MECGPGEELQVDFGQGTWVVDPQTKRRRRPHLFRCVLSCSRKGYSEVVWRQNTESFIRCLENAFRYFGGVTRTVVIDNLKPGVIKADWYDPELNPKLEEFARHYGTWILPTKPKTPRHKGKVESMVKYAQNNALKGRTFESLAAQNQHLRQWEEHTADTRIHGTTRKQVDPFFREVEKPALKPLPAGLFPVFTEAPRKVHSDGHIEFQGAFYSVPPEYARQKVWVRHQDRLVRIYYTRREPIALHAQAQPGAFHHRSPIAGSSRAIKAKSSAVAAGLRSVQVLDNNETVPPQQGSTPILAGAFPNHDGSKRMCGRYTRLHCGYVIR
jgi:hypothetical protein